MSTSNGPEITRQAVVVIHGMGEQRPMSTLRDFVKQIAPAIPNSLKPSYYSKPDSLSESFELRRLTANEQRFAFKTDYFELYWAHLIGKTTISEVWRWIRRLFLRLPVTVPTRLLGIYYTFWICAVALILGVAFTLKTLIELWEGFSESELYSLVVWIFSSTILGGISAFLLNYLGDVVKYITPAPDNIQARQFIRKAGLELFRKLHQKDKLGRPLYDRVIIVGHSLGSVIAYDLVNLFWIEQTRTQNSISSSELDKIENAGIRMDDDPDFLENYRDAQFQFWKSQSTSGFWKISDFITLGSPLAFSRLHLTDMEYPLEEKIKEREFPTCPPVFEQNDKNEKFFSYPLNHSLDSRSLHHAAPFSMTRWTNIYFKNDFVGGPITNLGNGVENFELNSERRGIIPFLSHTAYWNCGEKKSRELVRSKLQLRF